MSTRPTVVIIGAGFAGLYAAKALRQAPVNILMIDQHNYHTFQPLLYQVATAGLEAGEIAHQVRGTFHRQENVCFRQGTVTGIAWESQTVMLSDGAGMPFDYLILAAGAVYNDFGIPGVKEYGFFLKSLTEAVNLRSHILRQFERVDAEPELGDQGALNFVIVGGGPTGVEMAGALVELFDLVLPKDFPHVDMTKAKVIILEMQEFLLAPYTAESRTYTEQVLRQRGVDIRLGTTVAEVRQHDIALKGGDIIPTETLIWAAGIRAHPLVEVLGVELTRGGRVMLNPDLRIPGHPQAFVAGDMAGAQDRHGAFYPQVAPVAMQQGKHASRQIIRLLQGESTEAFDYFDKGIMAIIGRNAGIAELSQAFWGLRLRGSLGWLSWLFIHLMYLVGYQNRVQVFANWAYNYFTYDRHARLITDMQPSPGEIANRTGKVVSTTN